MIAEFKAYLSAKVTPAQRSSLYAMAEAEKISVSAMVRRMIEREAVRSVVGHDGDETA